MAAAPRNAALFLVVAMLGTASIRAAPLSPAERNQLAAGLPLQVIVEYNSTALHRAALAERVRRRLSFDDALIRAERVRGYAQIKAAVATTAAAVDAVVATDFPDLPMSVWRIGSAAALARLERQPQIVRVHSDPVLRPVSVSDLGFIQQPRAVATGATGAGATIAVIDGGLGTNYLTFDDFGTCTAVATPATTCRLVYNRVYFPNQSGATQHGTNVAAIALGVAPAARLAMFDVFNGTSTSGSTILSAMSTLLSIRAQYNIVALNLSLGAGSSNSAPCPSSVFATAIGDLAAAGIQTVAAAGNSGSKTGIDEPACVPGVVSVGAVYSQSVGTVAWQAPASPGGTCTESTAADQVTCFSQSASYLTVLSPGAFVSAPDASFQLSGTSQATPHVTGTLALLRARYPAESLDQQVRRLRLGATPVTDTGNQLTTPRLDAYAALTLGTALSLSGTGPMNAITSTNSTYQLTLTNNGPLSATHAQLTFAIPAAGHFVAASSGCSATGAVVTCNTTSLAASTSTSFSITVRWDISGPVSASTSLTADQINSSPQQVVAFIGTAPVPADAGGDAPLPPWMWVATGLLLLLRAQRHRRALAC
jgi:subtilisin family serine protease